MTLCVCGHPSEDHAQFDHGEYCFSCNCRDWRPIHKEAVDSEESTAPLSAGVTPEGLAEETVADDVKVTPPTDEARAPEQTVEPPELRTLLDAIETMDQKITPYGEREDGTILHYIVADSTWHRILAAARNPSWAAAVRSGDSDD